MDTDYGMWTNDYGKRLPKPEPRPPKAEYTVYYPKTLHAPRPTFPTYVQQHPGLMPINQGLLMHPPPRFRSSIERSRVQTETRQLLVNQRPEAVVGEGFQLASSKPLLRQVTVCDKGVQTLSKCCGFCWNKGESPDVFRTHLLFSPRGKLTCPVLRSYVCPLCQATGDDAHTESHCPQNRQVAASSSAPGLPRARQRIRRYLPPRLRASRDKKNTSA